MSEAEWKETTNKFKGNCCYCNSINKIHLDHYIPISWGHGGTTKGNCVPLCRKCNLTKKADQLPPSPERDRIEAYLASIIGCTPKTFRRYVDWCDSNRRKPDAITTEKTSFELFMESEAVVLS